jgi:hypothetical protein
VARDGTLAYLSVGGATREFRRDLRLCSRTLFFLFHDPEGPNLLVVTVLALILLHDVFPVHHR